MTYSLNTLNSHSGGTASQRTGLGRFAHEFGLALGLVALVFWLMALVTYSAQDPAFSTSGTGAPVTNWGGRLGARLADASYFILGFSVWWCVAVGVRLWLALLANRLRGDAGRRTLTRRWVFSRAI